MDIIDLSKHRDINKLPDRYLILKLIDITSHLVSHMEEIKERIDVLDAKTNRAFDQINIIDTSVCKLIRKINYEEK